MPVAHRLPHDFIWSWELKAVLLMTVLTVLLCSTPCFHTVGYICVSQLKARTLFVGGVLYAIQRVDRQREREQCRGKPIYGCECQCLQYQKKTQPLLSTVNSISNHWILISWSLRSQLLNYLTGFAKKPTKSSLSVQLLQVKTGLREVKMNYADRETYW